jgi:ABC-type phosphate/phosphonate transport system substrate-binding protein
MIKKSIVLVASAIVLLAGVSGCSGKYAAERDGKKLGEAVCDLRDADSQEDAAAALDDVKEQLSDMGSKYSFYTAEDRADVEENLDDLAEHVAQGQEELVRQDLAVIQRSVGNIADDTSETQSAIWDGVRQGLDDCTQ